MKKMIYFCSDDPIFFNKAVKILPGGRHEYCDSYDHGTKFDTVSEAEAAMAALRAAPRGFSFKVQDAPYPKVVAVLGVVDCGPCLDGDMTGVCPHCGAEGRYIYRFVCEDGRTYGAMKGCFKLFPKSVVAKACERAFDKVREADSGKGYASRADRDVVHAANNFAAGTGTLRQLESAVSYARNSKQAYMRKMGWVR